MASSLCRVCLVSTNNMVMVNIFEELEPGISIATMISESTGYKVEKGDLFPESICSICLQDARNAFEIKKTYERTSQFYSRLKKDLRGKENLIQVDDDDTDYLPSDDDVPTSDDRTKYTTTREKPHKCHQCPMSFSRPWRLQNHLRTHTGVLPFKSDHCSKSFVQKARLQRHLHKVNVEKSFKCTHCTKIFFDMKNLKIHLQVHTGKQAIQCSQCSKFFSQRGNLLRHLLIHTGERPYKCSLCTSSFNQSSSLKRHLKIHTG